MTAKQLPSCLTVADPAPRPDRVPADAGQRLRRRSGHTHHSHRRERRGRGYSVCCFCVAATQSNFCVIPGDLLTIILILPNT